MKKLFVMVMAAVAISFTSCGNKSVQQAEAAEAEVSTVDLESATADLAAQLEAGDVNKFQEAIEAAKEKAIELVQENPEAAKQYLTTVQGYLKENTDKIKEMIGDNAIVSTAVSTLVETPAESIISNLQGVIGTAEDAAAAKVEGIEQAAAAKIEGAQQAAANAQQAAANAQQAAADQAAAAKQAAIDQAEAAKKAAVDKANEKVEETKQAAADKVNEGAQKINNKVNEGANKLLKGAGLK